MTATHGFPNYSAVWHPTSGAIKRVKNLGWLIRNWKLVGKFEVIRDTEFPNEAILIAFDRSNRLIYSSPFASLSICREWLHRPVFRTLPLLWLGKQTEC